MLADFMTEQFPEVGQCVHALETHPHKPDTFYQQNHCGMYRSSDAGKTWEDISEGLPSRFGFVIQTHPRDHRIAFVIPEQGPEFRSAVDGDFAVWKTEDSGRTWRPNRRGLPAKPAYLHVLRQAFRGDGLDSLGLYVGTSSGSLYASRDEGKTWHTIAEHLPEIMSVQTAVES